MRRTGIIETASEQDVQVTVGERSRARDIRKQTRRRQGRGEERKERGGGRGEEEGGKED